MIAKQAPWLLMAILVAVPYLSTARADPQQSLLEVRAEFKRGDDDGDGKLALKEFLLLGGSKPDRRRRFLAFDVDGNGKLTEDEFHELSSAVDRIGDIPDPIVELERAALHKWTAIFSVADRDRSGSLSRAQWPQAELSAEIPEVADVFFTLWDRDLDDSVTNDEGRRLLEIAYGLTNENGTPLRAPDGQVFRWHYFHAFDVDRDGALSRQEFLPTNQRRPLGDSNSDELFTDLDANGDNRLTGEECGMLLWNDTVTRFFDSDRDGDGYVDTGEWLAIGGASIHCRGSIHTFDRDHDGKLSFHEFRQSTLANNYSDLPPRKDNDGDRRLSWNEFYTERAPILIAQYRFFFDRFDRDRDGFLSLAEFDFDVNLGGSVVNLESYLAPFARRLPLEIEFAKSVCTLSDGQANRVLDAGCRGIDRIADKLATAIEQHQTGKRAEKLVVINGQAIAVPADFGQDSPGPVLRIEILGSLNEIDPNAWRKLDAERQRLAERRRRTAILLHVAALDDALFLSSRQRNDLDHLLSEPTSVSWFRPAGSGQTPISESHQLLVAISGDSVGTYVVPEAWLGKFLTPVQSETLSELVRPRLEAVQVEQPAANAMARMRAGAVAPQQAKRRLVRLGPSLEDQERQLRAYMMRLVDAVDAASNLTQSQREKLLLAASLDVNNWREQRPQEKEPAVHMVQVVGAFPALPVAIFNAPSSFYRKALQGQLREEQKQRWLTAQRERLALQQQAMIEAVVGGYERAAVLTSAQCEKLSSALHKAFVDLDLDSAPNWRMDFLHCLAKVSIASFDGVCFDFQGPAALDQQAHLSKIAVQSRAGELFAAPPNAIPRAVLQQAVRP